VRALRLVIFDCDGVLVDSEVISNAVLARMLAREGLRMTVAQARERYQGLLLAEVVDRSQMELGHALPADFLERYVRERAEAFRHELRPVEGAREVVEAVVSAGVEVCVASQGARSKTALSLSLTRLEDLFPPRARFSAESVAHGKPEPDLFLHAASAMGTPPAACAVVEDTPSGIGAARAAGMRAFGLAADSDEAALRAAGGEVVHALHELPARLGLTSD
jgi:HAD superfamily hydrolase (TIGR01509 family)